MYIYLGIKRNKKRGRDLRRSGETINFGRKNRRRRRRGVPAPKKKKKKELCVSVIDDDDGIPGEIF